MILSESQIRSGNLTVFTVTSSLTGTVFYHWFIDGAYLGKTSVPRRSIALRRGDQSRIEVLDTNDANFDPIAHAPAGYPARRTLVWTRSLDARIDRYRVEQQRAGGSWTAIGQMLDDTKRWLFEMLSPRLDDLTPYAWRVVPIDVYGNDGTAVVIGNELIVRTPDAPGFTATFEAGSSRVLFLSDIPLPAVQNDSGQPVLNGSGGQVFGA